jgi:antitoxin component YwqK of YwqJK toxin-antitoxin module
MEWLKHLVIRNNGEGILVNNWKQGSHYEKYPGDHLEYEENYDCGQCHGIQRSWYWNKQIQYEWNYIHGQQHGIQQWWYSNGPIMCKENYINGVVQN